MANEQLVADLECILEDIDKDQEIGFDSWEDEEQLDIDTHNQVSSVDAAATPVRQQYNMTTLKKDCPTRWNCLLSMMDSLLINQQLVERCLAHLRLFDKMCSDDKWKTIANVVEFLKIFKTATEVLSGSKYPTLALFCYSELK
jgi:hypothetical protein